MGNYLKIDGENSYVRDSGNRAILNVDRRGIDAYKTKRAKEQEMERRIGNMENDLQEIKQMLSNLVKHRG